MVTEMQERIAEGVDLLIPPNLTGNKYLKTAIQIAMDRGEIDMNNGIYPQLVEKYALSSEGLKDYLTRTIKTCFENDKAKFEKFFGHSNCDTPVSFIDAFVEKMNAGE